MTALLFAAHAGHVRVVTELLRSGADIDATDNDGSSALSWAVKYEHREVETELVRHGATDKHSVSGGASGPKVLTMSALRAAAGEFVSGPLDRGATVLYDAVVAESSKA